MAWAVWGVVLLAVAATAWFAALLRGAGRPDLAQLDAGGLTGVLTVLSAATAGRCWPPGDPHTLAEELLAVADDTMQPTRASLWLSPPRRPPGP